MAAYICETCGMQFAPTAVPPARCPICEDERQYVGWQGQRWTTLETLQTKHKNEIRRLEAGLTGIATTPRFGIGQRALLIETPDGNLLWDCISLLDEQSVESIRALGGLAGIAISHPHYYASMVEWGSKFDCPIYLHAADREWVMRPDERIQFWEGEVHPLWNGLTLIHAAGHFAGGTLLHWPDGASGGGVLLTGDIINVASDRRYVSFMYSYPNFIPLGARQVRRIVTAVAPFDFQRIYGAWWDRIVTEDAKTAVSRSAVRYITALQDED